MSAIKETVKLIFCEADQNSNKVWTGILYDNDDVETRWGRVGNTLQSKMFPRKGRAYLMQKKKEKEKKGYTTLHTVEEEVGSKSVSVNTGDVVQVAKRDIITKSPELTALVDRLIKSNIHTITTSTSITYSSTTGLFSTPLGVVTPQAINDARLILADIKRQYNNEDKLKQLVSQYLRLIPHSIGMKFRIRDIFPDNDKAIKDELNILDSLESSYEALQTQAQPSQTDNTPHKRVFDVTLDVIKPDSAEWKRLVHKFVSTNKSMHGYQNRKIVNIYQVDIGDMTKNFDHKVGNNIEVFHGTSEANLLSILKSGLRTAPPSSAYIAGKMFGNGIYGTETASKSLGYTFGRWGGSTSHSGWMFICDFAMGKPYYPTTYGLSKLPTGYDSCWALPNKTGLHNDELIVYRNNQVKIKHLLEIR
jgi:poly [ADP-ribose] polymerase